MNEFYSVDNRGIFSAVYRDAKDSMCWIANWNPMFPAVMVPTTCPPEFKDELFTLVRRWASKMKPTTTPTTPPQ